MTRIRSVLLGVGSVLAVVALVVPSAGATVVHLRGGRFLGVTLRQGVSPAAVGAARPMTSSAQTGASSSSSSSVVSWHSGPVVHSSAPYLIFWTPSGESVPSSTRSLLQRYMTDAAAAGGSSANSYGVIRQYTDATGFVDSRQSFSAAQVITDTDAYPARDTTNCPYVGSGYPTCITDTQLQSELAHEVAARGLPSDGPASGPYGASSVPASAPVYLLVLPSDVNVCVTANGVQCASTTMCAWHSSAAGGGNALFYGVIPTWVVRPGGNPKACQSDGYSAVQEPNGSPADVVLKYMNHEDIEILTDPTGFGWYDNSGPLNEVADNCNAYASSANPQAGLSPNAFTPVLGGSGSQGTLFNQLVSGDHYYLQSEWSNGDGACKLQPSGGAITPSFTVPAGPDAVGATLAFDPGASTSTYPYTSATWSFGDGATQFQSSGRVLNRVSHAYNAPGTYPVKLTMVDNRGNLSTVSQSVSVYSQPTADFTVSASPVQGATTTFDGSGSSEPDPGVTISSYAWSFGDGTPVTTTASPTTPHVFAQAGTYKVSLTITNSVGLTSTASQTVTVDEAPSAVMAQPSPAQPLVGQKVAFDGSGSTDPDGAITGYSWNFGDGSGPVGGAKPTHTYTRAGNYTVTLTVTDSDGHTATVSQSLIAGAPPSASFKVASPADPVQSSPVSFDASASSDSDAGITITSYTWDFGDGTGAGGPTTTAAHTYGQPGTYTVKLTVTNSIGLSSTTSSQVVIDEAPSAVIAPTPSQPAVAQSVAFDGTGSADPDGNITSFSWNFGDGSPVATGGKVSHSYAKAGIYQVSLTVTDSDGQTATTVQTLIVGSAPAAQFTVSSPADPVQGSPVGFDGSASSDPDSGVSITSYGWDFGDGTTQSTNTPTTSHTYAQPGSYMVKLTVTNSLGLPSTVFSRSVTVDETPTAAFTTAPAHPAQGAPVSFDGSGSQDPDGTIADYSWSFGDGQSADTGLTATTTHTYAEPGQYTAALTVTDSDGQTSTFSQTVTVYAPPSALLTLPGTTPMAGNTVTLDASGSSDPNPGASIVSYQWSFGDGQSRTTTTASAGHTYPAPGTYAVSVKVTDSLGLTATANRSLTVYAPPVAGVPVPSTQVALTGSLVTFTAAGSRDPNNGATITAYNWDFGDGTLLSTTAPTASHRYATPGTYTVSVSVIDSLLLGASSSQAVKVLGPPNPAWSTSPALPLEGTPVSFDAGASTDPNSGTAITGYQWDFGDGQHAAGSSPTATHVYARAGRYTVTLTTVDSQGLSASHQGTVTIADEPPSVVARIRSRGPVAGQAVSFDGTGSRDPDGSIRAYSWSFGDRTPSAGGATPTHRFARPGTYTVSLTVTDSDGNRTSTSLLVVIGHPAHVTAVAGQASPSGRASLLITVNGPGRLRAGRRALTFHHAGRARVALSLSRTQKRALQARHTVRVRVTIVFTPARGSGSRRVVTVTLRPVRPSHARRHAPIVRRRRG